METITQKPHENTILRKLQKYTLDSLRDPLKRREFLDNLASLGIFWGIVFGIGERTKYLIGDAIQTDTETGFFENTPQELQVLPPVAIAGKRIQIIGATHTPKTFFAYEGEITQIVKNAPFIALEYFTEDIQQRALTSTTDERLKQITTYNDYPENYFGGIGRICAREGKDIVVVNPETEYSQSFEFYVAIGLPPALIGSDAVNIYRRIMNKKTARRHLLRGIGYLASGTIIASWADKTRQLRTTLEQKGILSPDLSEEEKADILGWNLIDYRNVRSAQGIEKAIKLFGNDIPQGQNVAFFQGSDHNGVYEYLKNPTLRDIKNVSYAPYHLGGENTIRRYTFNKALDQWELKQEIPY